MRSDESVRPRVKNLDCEEWGARRQGPGTFRSMTVHLPPKRKRDDAAQATCRDCSEDITLSAAELKLFEEIGKKRQRCDSCRHLRKERLQLQQAEEAAAAQESARDSKAPLVAGEKERRRGKLVKPQEAAEAAAAAAAPLTYGVVLRWNSEKGFGFIQPDGGGDDVFVHCKSIQGGTTELPQDGRVSYRLQFDKRAGKERAEQVRLLRDAQDVNTSFAGTDEAKAALLEELDQKKPAKKVVRHPACICHATPCYCGAEDLAPPSARDVEAANPLPKEKACFNCGEAGHTNADCKQPRSKNKFKGTGRAQKVCYKCKEEGHMSFECSAVVPRNAKKKSKKEPRRDLMPLPAPKKD